MPKLAFNAACRESPRSVRADEKLSATGKCGGRLASEGHPKQFGGVLQQRGDEPADGRASDGDRL